MADLLQPPFGVTVRALLAQAEADDRPVLVAGGETILASELARHARAVAARLLVDGVRPGDRVATALGNGPNHCAIALGAALAGAVWTPVSPDARGPSLVHMLNLTRPRIAFATRQSAALLSEAGYESGAIETDGWTLPERTDPVRFAAHSSSPDDVRAILFTSGTSGPPKGVQVTERMLAASAAGCALACDCRDGDAFLMWEPLHHIGGIQILLMALARRVTLVAVERFSASRFWDQVRNHRINKLHYLGGILEILLKAAPSPSDRNHPVELAFGGGCRPEIWKAFQSRFGIPIREVYGMTEASSFTTVNVSGVVGSVGTPVPWLDASICGGSGEELAAGEQGEIVVSASHPGLLTPGYLDNPAATAKLLRGGRLFTGDLGRRDAEGNFHFIGRTTDSLRRRGENISAWEVETALAANPDIAETAVVGVEAEIGEHEILCYVVMRDGRPFDPQTLAAWARSAMPGHHVPRYWKQVDGFERTPSQRIRKDLLARSAEGAADTDPRRAVTTAP